MVVGAESAPDFEFSLDTGEPRWQPRGHLSNRPYSAPELTDFAYVVQSPMWGTELLLHNVSSCPRLA
jgi:hypothetical protein